jgi:phosphatidylglycerophosphatase A
MFNRVAACISSGFGSGYAPKAPGTFGTIAAVFVWLVLSWLGVLSSAISHLIFAICVAVVGTIAAKASLNEEGGEDPQWIVIDEWAGVFVALIGTDASNWYHVATAFVLFRLFDITKPGPVSSAEELPEAFGVMADDLVAGAFALLGMVVMRVV